MILSWFIYDPEDLKVDIQFETKYCLNVKQTHAVRKITDVLSNKNEIFEKFQVLI